ELITIDGVRAEYADGFGLARASNTTPVVVLRFEADTQPALVRIKDEFKAALTAAWPGISTDF
ncbi:MAG: phosphomannomutase/phosphoglucomutase, partial [Sulfuritalea sp.]|nr:phosphomannomutase/phosphoglucomutase [Sulfuritalea sp.]